MKEYLQKFSWDSECWGESNVANFMKYEDELVEQCLQTPVNQDMRLRAVQAPPAQAFQVSQFQQPTVQIQRNTYPFVGMQNTVQTQYPFFGGFNTLYAHGRKKRSSDADWISASELKELWTKKVSNLTCYMKGMGVIDNNYNIKKDFLRKDVWEMKDTRATEHLSDSVWRNKLSQYWVDCAEMVENIPDQVLDNCPISRMFGPMARTMKFMMCKKEVTEKMCGMAQAEKLQRRYHPNCLGANGASILGVRDRYEEAMACAMTMMHSKMHEDSTGKFIKKAIRGEL